MYCATLHGANEITFLIIYYVNGTKVESDLVEHCVILVLLLSDYHAFTGLVFVYIGLQIML